MTKAVATHAVRIALGSVPVDGDLHIPARAAGLVVFAHGSGSSRFSRRNRAVAAALEERGLRHPAPRSADAGGGGRGRARPPSTASTSRSWAGAWSARWSGRRTRSDLRRLPVAVFGASTGAAAALIAAAARPAIVGAVISRGGRPDLAADALPRVLSPTLLIVGGDDTPVIEMNRDAMRRMHAPVELAIVPHATHLFEEPGALEQVAALAADWCRRYL